MAAVNTTLVVQFGGGASGAGSGLSAELDSREEGLNGGKTTFVPGDSAAFLIFATGSAVLDEVLTSGGTLTALGGGFYEMDEFIQFQDSREANLSKGYTDSFTTVWYGNDLGVITPSAGSTLLSIAAKGVGVAKVTYRSAYTAYMLNSPATLGGSTTFQILVVIKGHDDA